MPSPEPLGLKTHYLETMIDTHGYDRSERERQVCPEPKGRSGQAQSEALIGEALEQPARLDLHTLLLRTMTRYETRPSSTKAALVGYVLARGSPDVDERRNRELKNPDMAGSSTAEPRDRKSVV